MIFMGCVSLVGKEKSKTDLHDFSFWVETLSLLCGIRIRIAYPMRLGVNIDFRLDIRLKLWENRI